MAPLDRDGAAFEVSEIAEGLSHFLGKRISGNVGKENADAMHLRRPLGLSGERRGERSSQRGQQEAAAVHYCSENDMSTGGALMPRARESRGSLGLPAG